MTARSSFVFLAFLVCGSILVAEASRTNQYLDWVFQLSCETVQGLSFSSFWTDMDGISTADQVTCDDTWFTGTTTQTSDNFVYGDFTAAGSWDNTAAPIYVSNGAGLDSLELTTTIDGLTAGQVGRCQISVDLGSTSTSQAIYTVEGPYGTYLSLIAQQSDATFELGTFPFTQGDSVTVTIEEQDAADPINFESITIGPCAVRQKRCSITRDVDQSITLRRAFTGDMTLWQWKGYTSLFADQEETDTDAVFISAVSDPAKSTCTLSLLDRTYTIGARWEIRNAWPTAVRVAPLNTTENSAARTLFEEVTLQYDGLYPINTGSTNPLQPWDDVAFTDEY